MLVWGSQLQSLPVEVAALALVGLSAGAVMSVSSIAILGAAPMHRSGMAAGVEEVSYEFGTLLTVAITGSLLARWRLVSPVLDHDGAYTFAYHRVLIVLAIIAALLALCTWWCFRDNPKSGDVAQEAR